MLFSDQSDERGAKWREGATTFWNNAPWSLTQLGKLLLYYRIYMSTNTHIYMQGILEGEVSLYCWPPVWLVRNQLYHNWQFLFLFAKQTNPNLSNRRSIVQWYFPLNYSLHIYASLEVWHNSVYVCSKNYVNICICTETQHTQPHIN
jgi:hypothetical protein